MRADRASTRPRRYPAFIPRSLAIAVLLFACGTPDAAPNTGPVPPAVREEREPASAECADATDCRLRPRGCCPACGVGELDDVTADPPAPDHAARCADTPCPACPSQPNPNLFATCEAGRCVAVDVRQDALSRCAADADCAVIRPDCCACRPGYVAVSAGAEADYYRRQCGEVPVCSPCERHDIPASLVGRCVEGHCAVAERAPEAAPLACPAECEPVDQDRCQPDGTPCTCGYLHQPFADCEPGPSHPCPSARAFTVACDPRCCS